MNRFHAISVACLVILPAAAPARAQSCTYGEAASGNCIAPRVIPGNAGHHVVLMDCAAATNTGNIGGVPVGNIVYFEFVPTVSGPVTVSTCHPNTLYDTVAGLYQRGELCQFTYLTHNDDSFGADCPANCTGSASQFNWNVTAGLTYTILVGSYNSNPQGCPLCLGLIVSIGTPCGDPPRNFICETARPLSGAIGPQVATIDTADAIGSQSWPCQSNVGRIVWFSMTPQVTGVLRVDTCRTNTNFDTVIRVLNAPTGCGGTMIEVACADDPGCASLSTAAWVEASVTAGETYFIAIGGYNSQSGCLDVLFDLPDPCASDTQLPIAMLDAADFQCMPLAGSVQLSGTASDPENHLDAWVLEERGMQSSTWSVLAVGEQPFSGNFFAWQPATPGYRMLRLSVSDLCGHANSAVRLVYVDQGPQAVINSPTVGTVVGGNAVCIDGIASHGVCPINWTVAFAPMGSGNWVQLATGNSAIHNLPLAYWNTTAVPDGNYDVRLAVTSTGGTALANVQVVVDNTAPSVLLSAPVSCASVSGIVQVQGQALDANLSSWALQWSGGASHAWNTIATGTANATGLLTSWDMADLPDCAYALRLIAWDRSAINCGAGTHQTEYLVLIRKGAGGSCDVNGDGQTNGLDVQPFVTCLLSG